MSHSIEVSRMLEFSHRLAFCMVFTESGMSDGTIIEWGRDDDVLMAMFPTPPPPLLISVEKSAVKIRSSEAAIQAWDEKQHK